jgi:hypothetical protein
MSTGNLRRDDDIFRIWPGIVRSPLPQHLSVPADRQQKNFHILNGCILTVVT